MKKIGLVLGSVLFLNISAAQANEIQLARIDTNDCTAEQNEIQLLNGPNASIYTYCESGTFYGKNGRVYPFRLSTTVGVPYVVAPGMSIQLASIDTHNCSLDQSEVNLLNSAKVKVTTSCETGSFVGQNGQVYAERLNTYITINSL